MKEHAHPATVPVAAKGLNAFPQPFKQLAERYWQDFLSVAEANGITVPGDEFQAALQPVAVLSHFIATTCVRKPSLALDVWASGDLARPCAASEYCRRLQQALAGVQNQVQLGERLRDFRQREMVRIAWRDLLGRSALGATMEELSTLADTVLDQALDHLYAWQCNEVGTPTGREGQPERLVIVAMGKLGGRELNFSSDVDLIFAFPEEGHTQQGGQRGGSGLSSPLSHQEFFIRLGQRLIQVLSATTPEGLVFRVDMRLRPFGDSGPLAMSFEAMETYYQAHGREWERYAWIKARVAAGDSLAGARLLSSLKPFVYRRYLDYGAYQAMRQMKQLIQQEVKRKGLDNNIKLGGGGIREVEFTAQVFQLIRGGRLPALQERSLLRVLTLLTEHHSLPDYVARDLATAYAFLRNVEHRLQEFSDQQTHELPQDTDGQLRLALAMGFDDWSGFKQALDDHRQRVHAYFEQVFVAPQLAPDTSMEASASSPYTALWHGTLDREQAVEALRNAGFEVPEEALHRIDQLRGSHSVRALSRQGREQLDPLMPLLLGAVARSVQPTSTLQRVLMLVEAVARRTAYLSLLVENPMALSQLVKLCAASPWVTRLLTRHPLLLDELLDPRRLYSPLDRTALEQELDRSLESIPEDDLEQQMDALRQFKQSQVLRVAAADITGAFPLPRISDYLTAIAEVILQKVVDLALAHLRARHGDPGCEERGQHRQAGFAVIGYGKLGGIELGYGSDLDLVFLHDSVGDAQYTDGAKPIENYVFFSRLAQRIIHILTIHTHGGVLYPVDVRLRPSGASGLLVSSVEAFADYQRTKAWTWEYQALVRARPVAGSEAVRRAFAAVRAEVMGRERDPEALRADTCSMRERMRAEVKGEAEWFDLKQGQGGIVDIEFMVQYGVLRWAASQPALLQQTATLRLLEQFSHMGLMAAADAERLSAAYRTYRAEAHRLTLQEAPTRVRDDQLVEHRQAVTEIWQQWLRC
jgi:glutamate-ammonia-ligase adenylyltransferase